MFSAYISARYQVSVYRTIGPLVCNSKYQVLVEHLSSASMSPSIQIIDANSFLI